MKIPFALAAALAVTGCATQPEMQLASAECKVHPVTTAGVAGVRKPATDSLSMRRAEADLATSRYRAINYERNYFSNNVEDALRDCDKR